MLCKQTIIVAAPLGSGTSRVAMLLKQQGVFMGSHPNTSHEDLDFAYTFLKQSMLEALKQRNSSYSIWGWKFPFMRNWFDFIFPHLINPCFIYCKRNHTEKALLKPEKYDYAGIEEDYYAETAYWHLFFLEHPEVPVLFIDFNLTDTEVSCLLQEFIKQTSSALASPPHPCPLKHC